MPPIKKSTKSQFRGKRRRISVKNAGRSSEITDHNNNNNTATVADDTVDCPNIIDNNSSYKEIDWTGGNRILNKINAHNFLGAGGPDLIQSTTKPTEFIITDIQKISDLTSFCLCPSCKTQNLKTSIVGKSQGYAHKLQLFCLKCNNILKTSWTSPHIESGSPGPNPYEINRRIVLAGRDVGLGHAGISKFTSITGVSGSLHQKTYSNISKTVNAKLKDLSTLEEARNIIRNSYSNLYKHNTDSIDEGGPLDLLVSYDGSWHKRGYTSNYGFGAVIEVFTGLVIDYDILSKYCHECSIYSNLDGDEKAAWQEAHAGYCDKNHDGSSGSMETAIAVKLWRRSMDYNFRYTEYLGDGDTKTFDLLQSLQIYGDGIALRKEECINHVSKRMFRGLEKICKDAHAEAKASSSKKKINNPLTGKGKMTKDRMKKWSSYYRNAISNSAGDVSKMKDAIWAIFFHSISTSEDPHHTHCDKAWCFYLQANEAGEDPEEVRTRKLHDPPLPRDIAEKFTPLFRHLTNPELLERCKLHLTSNSNECLHSVIWRHVPKHTNIMSLKTLECGVRLAVAKFNKGRSSMDDAILAIGLSPSTETKTKNNKADEKRIEENRKRNDETYKETRKRKLQYCIRDEESRIDAEGGASYAAGIDTVQFL